MNHFLLLPTRDKLRSSFGIFANVLDFDIVVRKFELAWRPYVLFQTNTLGNGMNPPYFPSYRLDCILSVILQGKS